MIRQKRSQLLRSTIIQSLLKRSFAILALSVTSNIQEGWLSPTERASVSAISLRHILASPGYTPGTIAVNVTRMERGFNAGQSIAARLTSTIYEL